jgi:hypothetical protein
MHFSKAILPIFVALAVATDPNNNSGSSSTALTEFMIQLQYIPDVRHDLLISLSQRALLP